METNETARCNKQEAVGARQKTRSQPGLQACLLPNKNARAELKTNSPVADSHPANQHANERAEFFGNSEVA